MFHSRCIETFNDEESLITLIRIAVSVLYFQYCQIMETFTLVTMDFDVNFNLGVWRC
jgi:hypothetical protein